MPRTADRQLSGRVEDPVQLNIRLAAKQMDRLRKAAEIDGRSVSGFARQHLSEAADLVLFKDRRRPR